MKKGLKILLIIVAVVVGLVVAALFAIPRFIPTYVEQNSHALVGRKIDLGKVRLNYLSLTLRLTDFVLYESNEVDTFVSFDHYRVNLDLIPTLGGNYTISSMLLDNLNVNIETDGEHFNFEDLIAEGDTTEIEEDTTEVSAAETRFTLEDIELRNGSIAYYDSKEDIRHDLSHVGFMLPYFSWDNESSSEMGLTFNFEPQGRLELKADVDYPNERYRITAKIIDLALAPFSGYLESMLASQGIEGTLNNTIYVNGSMENTSDVVISGAVEISDFLLKDDEGLPVFKNGLLGVYLDSIDVQHNYYGLTKVYVSSPQVYVALFDTCTNFDVLMRPMTEAAEASDSLHEEVASVDSVAADSVFFQIDTILIDGGGVFLTDHTLNRPFKYQVGSIYTLLTDINTKAEQVPVVYRMTMNKSAQLEGDAQFSMVDGSSLNYSGDLKGLDLTSFSPYSEYYIARPITSGNLKFSGSATMTETDFNAENVISINDIELGAKTKEKAQVNIPVKLALGILKDKNGDVNFDVPMTGDPSDPDFNVGKIIGKTLADFVLKVAAAPFAIVGDVAGVNPERVKEIPLQLASYDLADKEKKTLGQIAKVLKKKPELEFHFTLEVPVDMEKEAIAMATVKAGYLEYAGIPRDEIGEALATLRNDDDSLMVYVSGLLGGPSEADFAEQCMTAVGAEEMAQALSTLELERHKNLQSYLLDSLQVDAQAVDVRTMDYENHQIDIKKPRYRVEVSVK